MKNSFIRAANYPLTWLEMDKSYNVSSYMRCIGEYCKNIRFYLLTFFLQTFKGEVVWLKGRIKKQLACTEKL